MTVPGPSARRLVWILGALLAGCDLTPDYAEPKLELPPAFRNAVEAPPVELPKPASAWWTMFGSAELTALVEEALANNHDLRAATKRLVQTESVYGQSWSALLPTVSLGGKDSLSSPRTGTGSRSDTSEEGKSERLYTISGSASYEIDLWGKNRASLEAAMASAQASAFDREVVATTLVAEVVNTYLQYLQAKDRETVARLNIDSMRAGVDAVTERARLGESSLVDVAQQRHVLAQTQANLPVIRQLGDQALNKLAALVGRPPAAMKLEGTTLAALTVPEVTPGLPADLLLRRPDIKKAEAALRAANANIGVARAKLFPSISLTGERGWGTQGLDTLLSPISIYYSLVTSFAATIFDFGKGEAEVAQNRAKYEEMVETYRQVILNALRDVDDGLALVRRGDERSSLQKNVVESARESANLSSQAFKIGGIDYLSLLLSERAQYEAEDTLAQALFNRLSAATALFKALGGSFERQPVDKS